MWPRRILWESYYIFDDCYDYFSRFSSFGSDEKPVHLRGFCGRQKLTTPPEDYEPEDDMMQQQQQQAYLTIGKMPEELNRLRLCGINIGKNHIVVCLVFHLSASVRYKCMHVTRSRSTFYGRQNARLKPSRKNEHLWSEQKQKEKKNKPSMWTTIALTLILLFFFFSSSYNPAPRCFFISLLLFASLWRWCVWQSSYVRTNKERWWKKGRKLCVRASDGHNACSMHVWAHCAFTQPNGSSSSQTLCAACWNICWSGSVIISYIAIALHRLHTSPPTDPMIRFNFLLMHPFHIVGYLLPCRSYARL